MVTRNSTNVLEFNTQNFGAPISFYSIDTGSSMAEETNPGEALEAIIELIGRQGTIVAVGAETAGAFRVAIENSTWTASTLQTALQGLGATVGNNDYNASATTVTAFDF
jgi:hypothetical protein